MDPRPILPVKVPITIDTMSKLYRAEYPAEFKINRYRGVCVNKASVLEYRTDLLHRSTRTYSIQAKRNYLTAMNEGVVIDPLLDSFSLDNLN